MIFYSSYADQDEKEFILSQYIICPDFVYIKDIEDKQSLIDNKMALFVGANTFRKLRKYISPDHTIYVLFHSSERMLFNNAKRVLLKRGIRCKSLITGAKKLTVYNEQNHKTMDFMDSRAFWNSLTRKTNMLKSRIDYLKTKGGVI